MKKKTYKEKSLELAYLIISNMMKKSGLASRFAHCKNIIEQSAKEYYEKAYDAGITHRGMKVVSAAAIIVSCQQFELTIEPETLIPEERHLKSQVESAKIALAGIIPSPVSG